MSIKYLKEILRHWMCALGFVPYKELSFEELMAQENVYGMVLRIREGYTVSEQNLSDLVEFFPAEDVKKILLEVVKHDRFVFSYTSKCDVMFRLPEDTAYEIFLNYAKGGGMIDNYSCEDICDKLPKKHTREILLELARHDNFYLPFSAKAKEIVPELCDNIKPHPME